MRDEAIRLIKLELASVEGEKPEKEVQSIIKTRKDNLVKEITKARKDMGEAKDAHAKKLAAVVYSISTLPIAAKNDLLYLANHPKPKEGWTALRKSLGKLLGAFINERNKQYKQRTRIYRNMNTVTVS